MEEESYDNKYEDLINQDNFDMDDLDQVIDNEEYL